MLKYFNGISESAAYEPVRIYARNDREAPRGSIRLTTSGSVIKWFLLDGRRITPIATAAGRSTKSALVRAMWNGISLYREILSVFEVEQNGAKGRHSFAQMRWMKQTESLPTSRDYWTK
jgi:hypothetical protein